jgi:hypothetical protein
MDDYERRMNALRHGELLPAGDELTYDVNADLKAHSSAHKRKAIERESYLSKEQLMELRKVQNERIEVGFVFFRFQPFRMLTLVCRLER